LRERTGQGRDYKKLGRVIKYLRSTVGLALTLEGDDAQIVKWWVDASFAVHTDMKSHTKGTLSLGKGSVYSASTRQKLNTKSSTKAELCDATHFVDAIFLGCPGLWRAREQGISGQPERHLIGEERALFQ
jgi:hypothetical protein